MTAAIAAKHSAASISFPSPPTKPPSRLTTSSARRTAAHPVASPSPSAPSRSKPLCAVKFGETFDLAEMKRVSSAIPSRSRISAQWSAMVISRELNMGIPPAGFPDAVSMINTGPLSAVTYALAPSVVKATKNGATSAAGISSRT